MSYTFGFIGLGLIGGSIAKALRRCYPDCRIIVNSRSSQTSQSAISDNIADSMAGLTNTVWTECDYIFLCAPVETNNDNLRELSKVIFGSKAIVTDVGSVKRPILDTVRELNMESQFIGGHPMAGSERFGYVNSNPALLENAYYILAPTDYVDDERVEELKGIVQNIGAIPLVLDADDHDYVTGAISHLPHVVSAALVNLVEDEDNEDGIMKLVAAGGFKDITRISSSSPDIWQQICLTNRDNILALLNHYIGALENVKNMISDSDKEELYYFFEDARDYRDSFADVNSGPIKIEYVITVDIADKPGAIAAIAAMLSLEEINIKNIGINHNRELQEGALRIEFYDKTTTERAITVMRDHGYTIHTKAD